MNRQYAFLVFGIALCLGCGASKPSSQTASAHPTIEELRQDAQDKPQDGNVIKRLALAELLADDGDPSRANEELAKARTLKPNDPLLLLMSGVEVNMHGDADAAFELFAQAIIKSSESNAPENRLVSEVAAAAIGALQTIVPRYRARISPLLELFNGAHQLGPATSQLLANSLIEVAYRNGDLQAVKSIAKNQGCLTEWQAAGPFGPRMLLGFDQDFAADAMGPMKSKYDLGPGRGVHPTAELEARGCRVHLGSKTSPGGGTTYAKSSINVTKTGNYVVRLETPNSTEMKIDGKVVLRLDRRKTVTPRISFHNVSLSAGKHEVAVKITTRHPNPVVLVSISDANGLGLSRSNPQDAYTDPTQAALAWPADTYLWPTVQVARGDILGARQTVSTTGANTAALLSTIKSGIAQSDPHKPDDMRRDEARKLLRSAAARDPKAWYPAMQLARLTAAEGRDQEAIKDLRRGHKLWPKVKAFPILLSQLMLNRGWDADADRYVDVAYENSEDMCDPIQLQLSRAQRNDHVDDIEKYIELALACDARSNERFARLTRLSKWDEAKTELDRLQALEPKQSHSRYLPARLSLARSTKDDGAIDKLILEMRQSRPQSSLHPVAQADRMFAQKQSDKAISILSDAINKQPSEMGDLRRLRKALGGKHALADYRVDGEKALKTFIESGRSYDQPQVLVLDYSATRVFKDYSALTVVHQIYKLQSEEAVDEQGEFSVPAGAYLLQLHTIKPDGSRLEPDAIGGKDTISLPSLAVGDYVEYEYVKSADPPAGIPNGMLGGGFFFKNVEVPFDRSELLVIAPSSMKVTVDSRGDAPKTQRETKGDLQMLRWRVDQSAPLVQEPSSVAAREFIPSIFWGIHADWQKFVEGLSDLLADRDVADPEAKGLAEKITKGQNTDLKKARAIYQWVIKNVENNDNVFGLSPAMLASRTGNRARVIHYLCGLVDVKSELLLVRSFGADQTKSELADESTYTNLLLRVGSGSDTVYTGTSSRGAPFGYVAPAFRGQDALLLSPKLTKIMVPDQTVQQDTRHISTDVDLHKDGSATLKVVERYTGLSAISWRDNLDGIAEAMLNQRFEEAYLGQLIAGASLKSLKIEGRKNAEQPLVMRYEFDVPSLGRRQGPSWIVPTLFASGLASSFARLPQRTTTQISGPVDNLIQTTIHAPKNAVMPKAPESVALSHGLSSFRSDATLKDRTITIERSIKVPLLRVKPNDYGPFAQFCRSVDEAEGKELRITLPQ